MTEKTEKPDLPATLTSTVAVTSEGHHCEGGPGDVIIVCASPGFRRAGIEHGKVKIYGRGNGKNKLTEQQLVQLRKEPLITVIEVS